MNAHLSQDELIERIYGVGSAAGSAPGSAAGSKAAHLRDCAECSTRFEALLRTRTLLREGADLASQPPSAFFAAQRRAVYARLDRAAASQVGWAPALAGAGLLAVGLLLFPHGRVSAPMTKAPVVQAEGTSDDQLLSDLYSKEQSLEPSAEAPLHELFDPDADGQ